MPHDTVKRSRTSADALKLWITALATTAAIATFLGFWGNVWWLFGMLDHPRPQYCLILLIALLLGVLSRQPWRTKAWNLVWVMPLAINLWLLLPLFAPPGLVNTVALASPPAAPLTVLHMTLDHSNPDIARAIAYIKRQKPDMLSLLEITPRTFPRFQAELSDYQVVIAEPRWRSQGSAWLVSRHPSRPIQIQDAAIISLPPESDRPMLRTRVSYGGAAIDLLSFQAVRPRSADTYQLQQAEFAALADWSQQQLQQGRNLIVIGDFNSTPWSALFRQLLPNSGLVNSQTGFGLQPSWNANLPSLLQIPINHCLHSRSIATVDRHIGDDIGSDHLPLLVKLQV
jgi:endonuclease/exonuclease/phosphatase (EEP) superfamily protein YafD